MYAPTSVNLDKLTLLKEVNIENKLSKFVYVHSSKDIKNNFEAFIVFDRMITIMFNTLIICKEHLNR